MSRTGSREVPGFSVGEPEKQQAWEDLFEALKQRGGEQIRRLVTGDNQATIHAISSQFPRTKRQQCVMQKREHVCSSVPARQRDPLRPEVKAICDHKNRDAADRERAVFLEKEQKIAPGAVPCRSRDREACFPFNAFPKEPGKTIRTTNGSERRCEEVNRRSHIEGAAFRPEGRGSCSFLP